MADPIHIEFTRFSAFYSPLIATLAGSYLKDEGFEPTFAVSKPGVSAIEGLHNGTVHVAQSAPSQHVWLSRSRRSVEACQAWNRLFTCTFPCLASGGVRSRLLAPVAVAGVSESYDARTGEYPVAWGRRMGPSGGEG